MTAIPPTDRAPHRNRVAPDNERLRLDHAAGEDLIVLAACYGVAPASLYQHWRRLGLSGRGRMDGYVASTTSSAAVAEAALHGSVTPEVPVKPAAPEPVAPSLQADYGALSPEDAVAVVAAIEASAPLGLRHLALAVRLAAETGIPKAEAIAWVRADIHAVALARVIPPAEAEVYNEAMAAEFFDGLLQADETRRTRQ